MAKLSAHGTTLFLAEYATTRIAYMSDGKILRNAGHGWKAYRTVKPGVDVQEHAQKRKAAYSEFLAECPTWARFIKLMKAAAPFAKRYLLLTVIELMPGDADGVWMHANDDLDLGLGIDEVVELCEAYVDGAEEREKRADRIVAAKANA